MSIADSLRICALETAVAALLGRVAVLEACRGAETSAGGILGARCIFPTQGPSSAPTDDAAMADVIDALRAGQSIRRAADMLGLDRNKVARLRQRAIAEGWLTVSQTETMRRHREA